MVPDIDGPVHPYMVASPGCWSWYTSAFAHRHPGDSTGGLHVDCYAVQHPGGSEHDRRQRQSVAVHLTTLAMHVDLGVPAAQLARHRQRMSRTVLPRLGLEEWPHLPAPADLGPITIADVRPVPDGRESEPDVGRWSHAAWDAWSDHHRQVRRWAEAALT